MNNFLKQIHNKIFGRNGYPNEPYLHYDLKRNKSYIDAYINWKKEKKFNSWMNRLSDAINLRDTDLVEILRTETSNGFIFYLNRIEKTDIEVQFVFDLFKDRIKQQGYVCHLSDTRIFNRKDFVEEKNRYFLKPRFEYCNESCQFIQRYGNIILEVISRNDEPYILKICNHSYRDRKYCMVENFDELTEELFKVV